jgi:hypothetical protein
MDATLCKKGGDGAGWRRRSARRAALCFGCVVDEEEVAEGGCVVDEEEVVEGELQFEVENSKKSTKP